ncbi:MAG: Holliday junction resolvase RuvX [Cellvibrionaceae bacterium]
MQTLTALAFDYGLRSIGVAYGQSLTGTARPLQALKAKDGIPDWTIIEALIKEWKPNLLVIGLPLNMDDSESELSKRARKFGNRLHGRFNIKIAFMDERLSSFEAKQDAKEKGHKGDYKKDPIDSFAAQIILEGWFRTQA